MQDHNKLNSRPRDIKDLTITGIVERIVYINEENLYTVAVVQEESKHDVTTIVGNFTSISPGETLELKGQWIINKKFGEQFKVTEFHSIIPSTVYAIRKYLGSGLVKGIGEKFAERIVNRFGANTLNVIENDASRLSIIEGMGKKRISCIKQAWDEQKEIREIMIFLQGCGVGCANAVKIYKEYGNSSIAILKENPYKMAMDISGIGFKTADSIAQKMGIPFNSKVRVEAGIIFILYETAIEGHVFCPFTELLRRGQKILGVSKEDIDTATLELKDNGFIVVNNIEERDDTAVYLKSYYMAEESVCKRLIQIENYHGQFPNINIDKAVNWVSEYLDIQLSEKQEDAIRTAIENSVTVITGGPGVGKTTIINSIIKILEMKGQRILLAAPTGRAAKKLSESTGRNSMTIHRLLKFSAKKRIFEFNEINQLPVDILIIDEVSMIDINLMNHLLRAVPFAAKLILVGDIDQLPSVGPGNVLRDIINAEVVATVRLTEIFRQSGESLIVENAHKINHGELPSLPSIGIFTNNLPEKNRIPTSKDISRNEIHKEDRAISDHHRSVSRKGLPDFFFIECEDPKEIASNITKLCQYEIPKIFGFDNFKDIQVLTPMHKGDTGAAALNSQLQEKLNPDQKSIIGFARKFCINDKVMQIKNNYDKDVFNGDIGRIVGINRNDGYVSIEYDRNTIKYELSELDEIVLSYAITIHKSQGNEYPAVVIPITTQHYIMLQRNLIYTAITRGKKLVVIVGTKKAIKIAVANNKISHRCSLLKDRLLEAKREF